MKMQTSEMDTMLLQQKGGKSHVRKKRRNGDKNGLAKLVF